MHTFFFAFIFLCFWFIIYYVKLTESIVSKHTQTQWQMNSMQELIINRIGNKKKNERKLVIKTTKPGNALWITSDQEQTS